MDEVNGFHSPEPTVVYDPALDILEVRNGEESVTSGEFAKGTVVYFDKDSDAHEAKELAFTVAVRLWRLRRRSNRFWMRPYGSVA